MFEEEYTNCNLCGKDETTLYFEVEEKITGTKEKFKVVQCKHCGLIYLNPRPTPSVISKYYPEETYYAYGTYGDRKKALKQRLKEVLMEYLGHYRAEGKEKVWLRWLAKLIALLWKNSINVVVSYKEKGRVLDVGCGVGQLLGWLKRHNWSVAGVEISKQAAEYGNKYGLNIFTGNLLEARFPADSFDTVVINQVLEHLYNPCETLKEAHRILKPGGMLIAGVPNINSYESRIFRNHWSSLDIPRHLYFFSMPLLESMLTRMGFKIRETIGKTFLIPHNTKQSLLSLREQKKRYKVVLQYLEVYLLKPIFYLLSPKKNLFGDFITVYAIKSS